MLKGLAYGGFKPADNAYLDPVREMEAAEACRRQARGDAGKIAKAQAVRQDQGRARGQTRARNRRPMPTPPSSRRRPAGAGAARADLLVWGVVVLLLIIAFKPVEMSKLRMLFTNCEQHARVRRAPS